MTLLPCTHNCGPARPAPEPPLRAPPPALLPPPQVLSNREAVELAVAAGSPEAATRQLMDAAQARWALQTGGRLADDITVVVAYL